MEDQGPFPRILKALPQQLPLRVSSQVPAASRVPQITGPGPSLASADLSGDFAQGETKTQIGKLQTVGPSPKHVKSPTMELVSLLSAGQEHWRPRRSI